MSIETDLYTALTNDAGFTALCATRLYPGLAPDDTTRPYVTYQVVSGTRITTLPGTDDATRKRIQMSCHADTYSEAKSVGAAVEAALVGGGYLELEYDLYDPGSQVHTTIIDWSFMKV